MALEGERRREGVLTGVKLIMEAGGEWPPTTRARH